MFRKTITRLAYSPALAEELSVYARQLRREEVKRQIGLIFIALALVIQLFAISFPPESANAGSAPDFIEGGFSTLDEYLRYYDQNTHDIKDLFTSLGISRSDLRAAHPTNLEASSGLLVWKTTSRGDGDDRTYTFLKSDGTTKTMYYRPLKLDTTSSESNNTAYTGSSPSAGWFAILKSSGDLVTKVTPSSSSGACPSQAILPDNAPLPISLQDAKRCSIKLVSTLSADNLATNTPATFRSARASDRIVYTLTVKNNDDRTVLIPLNIGIADLLEYAQLMDKGGSSFNHETKTLSWEDAILPPGTALTRSFIVRLLPTIPSTATGQNNPASYDCIMSSSFGETLHIPVTCPFPKAIERITSELPPTSVQTNLIFAVTLAIIATFFYIRSRQLRTELRLIRHSHQGTL
jgi:hypothetical protein